MKKFLLIFFCLLLGPVYGQSSKTQLTTEINTNLPTNGANKISAATLRSVLIDMVNSWLDLGGAASLLCPTNQYVTGFTSLSIPQCSSITTGSIPTAALTSNNDTNVTITLGGSPATALVNAASISLGWSGTLAASRLNSNVVQSVVNDTNVTGSITAQSLTLGWTGALGLSRGGLGGSQFAATANQVPVFPGGGAAAVPTSFSAWQPGAPANVLNTQTANYSIATTDCGKTIQAGTGSTGFFTITLPAVTGFTSNCVVDVQNGDTARGKGLSGFPTGLTSPSILWPLQTLQVSIVNGAWAITRNPGRWAKSNAVFYVDTTGNDSNDGLATGTGAFLTLDHCRIVAQYYIDTQSGGNGGVTCSPTAGQTFQEFVQVFFGLTGGGSLIYSGNGGAFTWKPINSGYALQFGDLGVVGLTNVTFSAAGVTTPQGLVTGHNTGVVDFNTGISLVGASGIPLITCDYDAHFNINNGLTYSGGGSALLNACQGSSWNINTALTSGGTQTLTNFVNIHSGAKVLMQGNVTFGTTGLTSGAGLVTGNGVWNNLSGSVPPGGAPTPATGGQYCTSLC